MVDKSQVDTLCEEYANLRSVYEQFSFECEKLIGSLLEAADISNKCHSVTHRSKDVESLERKVALKGKQYGSLSEITDLAGVRIITYFADDVDVLAALIEEEFDVDWENSIDKRATLDPDRFGYLSLHYVCKHKKERAALRENSKFHGLKLEIQIRSILQHAWAEIEHDLGYKNPEAIPALVKRRTYSLAGLLEVGDNEFIHIRDDVKEYEASVPEEITSAPETVQIDKVSLIAYLSQDSEVRSFDHALAKLWREKLEPEIDATYVGHIARWLHYVDLRTIEDVSGAVRNFSKLAIKQMEGQLANRSGQRTYSGAKRGIGLFRLCLVLLARSGDRQDIVEAYDRMGFGVDDGIRQIAENVVRTSAALWKSAEDSE